MTVHSPTPGNPQQMQAAVYTLSSQPPPAPSQTFTRAKDAIALSGADTIRLINTTPARTNMIRLVIQQCWKEGIQREKVIFDQIAHEFKLKGLAWNCIAFDAVISRKLVLGMIRAMAQMGWNLLASVDVVTLGPNADTMYFELDPRWAMASSRPIENADMFAVSFYNPDSIRLIDASVPVVDCIRHAIQTRWSKGIAKEEMYHEASQFKLKGNPLTTGSHEIEWKLLLLQILANLNPLGYKLYGSVDVQSNNGSDTLVFRKIGPAWS